MNGELRETDLSVCRLNMSLEGTEKETRPISSNYPKTIHKLKLSSMNYNWKFNSDGEIPGSRYWSVIYVVLLTDISRH